MIIANDAAESDGELLREASLLDSSDEKTLNDWIKRYYRERYDRKDWTKLRYDLSFYKRKTKEEPYPLLRLYQDLVAAENWCGSNLSSLVCGAGDILEEYWVYEPHAKIIIYRDGGNAKCHCSEPKLILVEQMQLSELRRLLSPEIQIDFRTFPSNAYAEAYLTSLATKIVKNYKLWMDDSSLNKILYYIVRDSIYYEKIDPLMRDPRIEDISCNGVGVPLYIFHSQYQSIPTNIVLEEYEALNQFVVRLAYMGGKTISIARPFVDASLPDQSRIQLTLGEEITPRGPSFTIRKFKEKPITVIDLVKYNTLSEEMAAWFWFLMENNASSLVVGGTASGKTTTINVLSTFLRPTTKIVSIEDTAELQLQHENWISSVTRLGASDSIGSEIDLYQLLRQAMRQRPEFIIVGEVRGAEAYTLFQAMATGHGGLATMHADSVSATIRRLESEPMNIPRPLMTILDAISIQALVRIGEHIERRIIGIYEILDLEEGAFVTNEVFKWNAERDVHQYSGRSFFVEKIADRTGVGLDEIKSKIDRRRAFLSRMVEKNVASCDEVFALIDAYYADPGEAFEKLEVL